VEDSTTPDRVHSAVGDVGSGPFECGSVSFGYARESRNKFQLALREEVTLGVVVRLVVVDGSADGKH